MVGIEACNVPLTTAKLNKIVTANLKINGQLMGKNSDMLEGGLTLGGLRNLEESAKQRIGKVIK